MPQVAYCHALAFYYEELGLPWLMPDSASFADLGLRYFLY
jgi:hypothetical protein